MEAIAAVNIKPIPLSDVVRARYAAGRISLPVRRDQYLYSHLKNVSGFPTSDTGAGFPLSKLRTLDILIEQMKRLKGDDFSELQKAGIGAGTLSEHAVNKLIEVYSRELHAAAVKTGRFFSGYVPEAGLLLDIVA
jgi:hypothetical protein